MHLLRFATRKTDWIRSKTGRLFFPLALLAAAGCPSRPPASVSSAPSPSIAELSQAVAQIRGLEFKSPVTQTDQAPTTASPNDEYAAQDITSLSRAYKRIGLFSESVDLGKSLVDFSRLRRIASYEAKRRAIIIAPEAVKTGQALVGDAPGNGKIVANAIALSHALHEQHFQWQERVRNLTIEDRKLAFRAVAEGDAIKVALTFLHSDRPPPTWTDQVQATERFTDELARAGSSLPTMLREKLIFPYRAGSQFVQWAYSAKGWKGVNGLFAEPPVSSAQILHPEKFYLRREDPLQIMPFGWLRRAGTEAVVEQTLGEYLIEVLLAWGHSRQNAARIASAWRGDTLSAYPDGANLMTIWLSAWSSDGGAQDFYHALQTVLERHNRFRFTASSQPSHALQADLDPGRSTLLQAKGSLVLLLDGVASARTAETTDAIWKDLEIGTESQAIPFETAKRTTQPFGFQR